MRTKELHEYFARVHRRHDALDAQLTAVAEAARRAEAAADRVARAGEGHADING
jgi:hypothetical protein